MNKNEIIDALQTAHLSFCEEIQDVPLSIVNRSADGKWSAAQHVDHINKSIGRFSKYMLLPKEEIAERFGRSERKSVTDSELRENYFPLLSKGIASPAPFVPDDRADFVPAALMQEGKAVLDVINNAGNLWTEDELDEYTCPHPALGKLTVREMLSFSIFHIQHHHRSVKKLIG